MTRTLATQKGGSGSALIITEVDGSPSGTPTTLKFSNGSVTNNGDGSFTVTTGAGGGGDFSSNTATSVDSEVVLFSGTGGKTGKRATGTGVAHLVSGVLSASNVVTADITDANITLAKMADVATATVFYRKTGGTGVPEVQTLATLKTDLGLTGTNSGDQTITLTSEVTGSGTGSFATTLLNSAVIGKVLTGYTSGAGTVAATDTILQAIQKLNGNDATNANLTGPITSVGNATTVASSINLPGSPTTTTQAVNDNSTKIATTAYVDNAVLGQDFKEAVRVATTANLVGTYSNGASGVGATFTYTATGVDTVDGVALALGDRILLKNQTTDFQNGIYTVTTAGTIGVAGILTRALDTDQSADWKTGASVFVTAGTTLTSTTWAYTGIDSPTMGTTSLTFVQVAGQGSFTGGTGITITGTSIAIDTSVTVDKTTTQTLTNKRVTKRVVTVSGPGATPTTNTDNCDIAAFTALAAAITSMTTNLSGTPVNGDMLMFQFTDNGTARAITWGTSFASTTSYTLPTTTVISTLLRVLVQWNSTTSKWECIGTA